MSASNRAIVHQVFVNGLDSHDISVMRVLMRNSTYNLPLVGELRGEALMQFFESLFAAFPDLERNVDEQLTDGMQHVVTRWTMTGTHRGEFLGIAPTGKRICITGMSLHRIANGEIVEEWHQWDSLGLMQQLGVVPALKLELEGA
ncbi:MAG TPA: ester cyclase [Dongiaceae bacterium]|nr:ester cyclase [Dongiaceae bacterium]